MSITQQTSELKAIQPEIDLLFLDRLSGGFFAKLQTPQKNLSRLHKQVNAHRFKSNSPADQLNQSIVAAINDLDERLGDHNSLIANISKMNVDKAAKQLFTKLDALADLLQNWANGPQYASHSQTIDQLILLIKTCKLKSRQAARAYFAHAYKTSGINQIAEIGKVLLAGFNGFANDLSIITPEDLSIEKQVALIDSNLQALKIKLNNLLNLSMDTADGLDDVPEGVPEDVPDDVPYTPPAISAWLQQIEVDVIPDIIPNVIPKVVPNVIPKVIAEVVVSTPADKLPAATAWLRIKN